MNPFLFQDSSWSWRLDAKERHTSIMNDSKHHDRKSEKNMNQTSVGQGCIWASLSQAQCRTGGVIPQTSVII